MNILILLMIFLLGLINICLYFFNGKYVINMVASGFCLSYVFFELLKLFGD